MCDGCPVPSRSLRGKWKRQSSTDIEPFDSDRILQVNKKVLEKTLRLFLLHLLEKLVNCFLNDTVFLDSLAVSSDFCFEVRLDTAFDLLLVRTEDDV